MKKTLFSLLTLMSVCLPYGYVGFAQKVSFSTTVDGYTYFCKINHSRTAIVVTISPKPTGTLTLPSTLDKYPVTHIDTPAFQGSAGLTSVTLSEGVLVILNQAFSECFNLTSIMIPPTVTNICRGAFQGCTQLRNITIPESVTKIGRDAFQDTAIWDNHPDGVVYVDGWACGYKGDIPLGQLILQEGTRGIAEYAFAARSDLQSVTIPSRVTHFGHGAFLECSNLTSVSIQSGVTSIGSCAFIRCTNLTNVEIPEGVTTIGFRAFDGCSKLKSVTLPSSITSIGSGVFIGCSNLISITIPEKITSIENRTFSNCSLLTNVTFLSSIAPNADRIYAGTPEELTTYVFPDSKGWDGNLNSKALPALWQERKIFHVSNEPLVAQKEHLAAKPAANAAPPAKPAGKPEFHVWLDKHFPDNKGDYETLANRRGANGYTFWESYVAGLNPRDDKSKFRASITMKDGNPVITWNPHLRDRTYTVVGKESLTDTADWGKTNNLTRFFKVKVELPGK